MNAHVIGFGIASAGGSRWGHTLVIGFNGLDVLQLAQIPQFDRLPGCCGQEVSIF